VRMFRLREYFPHIINSYNLGIEKKSVKALRYILTKFKAKAKETLMIDDQAYNFVNADKMGIMTILYKNPGQLKKEVNSWLKGF
jgi:HAD superfamily hydrolase (TIGR01509 family)